MRRPAMRRVLTVLSLAVLLSGAGTTSAVAMTYGGGESGDASGQVRAEEECENVWSVLQEDLRAGGGPKSGVSEGPIGTYPDGSGPTNCDHFWQLQEEIGN
jgi:hypothetical protein